jgi:plasmid rolling circle replication initiator protein Rep
VKLGTILNMITTPHLAEGQDVSERVHRLSTLKRISINETYPALLDGLDYNEYAKTGIDLLHCSEQITINKNGSHSTYRCKKRVCLICSELRAAEEARRLTLATDQISEDLKTGKLIGLKLTLNLGPNSQLTKLLEELTTLSKCWAALLRFLKRIGNSRPIIKGYMKAIEISAAELPIESLNPHIHSTLLIDPTNAPANLAHLIKTKWTEIVRRAMKKRGEAPQIETYAQQAEELWSQTAEDALSWLKYSAKGALTGISKLFTNSGPTKEAEMPNDLPSNRSHTQMITPLNTDLWCTLHTALKGKRLISYGGEMATLIKKADEILAEQKDEMSSRRESPLEASTEYRWSWASKQYIPSALWSAEVDRRAYFFLLSSISYMRQLPRNIYRAVNEIQSLNTLSDKERIKLWGSTGKLPKKHRDRRDYKPL